MEGYGSQTPSSKSNLFHPAVDVYALGGLLYQLSFGVAPFIAPTDFLVICRKKGMELPKFPKHCDAGADGHSDVVAVIKKLMAQLAGCRG